MDRPVLFVAREPDETLRTYLPVLDELARREVPAKVLFHHTPGEWARQELARRRVPWWEVKLPEREAPWPMSLVPMPRRLAAPLGELGQLRLARAHARSIIDREHPRAVIVIQDTLLLERFIVRWANRAGIPTVVVQWAFNFPQDYYDRLRAIKAPLPARPARASRGLYARLQRLLDIRFNMVNSYGGGEARYFTVMGAHFAEQYREQGVTDKEIVVTGHPMHDVAYQRVHDLTVAELTRIRTQYTIPDGERVVLYATQPFFWRGVITPEELRQNVGAMNAAVARLGNEFRLSIKPHPRESIDDYGFCAELDPPVRLIATADMTDLIAVAEIFISSSSSTVLLAMMLDRPIVTVNFNQVLHFDFFESIGGTLHCRTFDELDDALQRITSDATARDALAMARRGAVERLARFDGGAAVRIADLLFQPVDAQTMAPSPPRRGLG